MDLNHLNILISYLNDVRVWLCKNVLTHVADRADAAPHHLSLRYLHGQPQVRYPHMTCVVQQDVLGLTVPIDQALEVQVFQPAEHLKEMM